MANYLADLRKEIGSRPVIMVGAGVLVFNSSNELLLQLRSDSEDWGLPGGAMELGESFEQTAKRELFEETGLTPRLLKFVQLLSGEHLYYEYPNGDEVYNVIALYETAEPEGELVMDDGESMNLKYFPLDHLPINLHKITQIMLAAFLDQKNNQD
ncbi:NUDIX hydrolase [Radiobacillus sp. PE A8.2]|uniref:NUDIX hydrolase n=1 Tax=Radiobacillus sp. PE A8.2 TaxID=3380349 RepID=UPI00388DFDB4